MRCGSIIPYRKASCLPLPPPARFSVLSSRNPPPFSLIVYDGSRRSGRSLSGLSGAPCKIITMFGIRQPRSNNRLVLPNSFSPKRLSCHLSFARQPPPNPARVSYSSAGAFRAASSFGINTSGFIKRFGNLRDLRNSSRIKETPGVCGVT